MGNRLTVLLLVLVAGLGALVLIQGRLGLVQDSPIQPLAPPELPALPPGPQAVDAETADLARLTETVERPLFTTDRRPVPEATVEATPEAPVVAATQQSPPSLELSAIVIEEGRRMALFRGAGASGSSLRAEEGEEVEGWTLSAVRSDGVTLEQNGRTIDIALRTFKPPPSRPAPAAARQRRGAGREQIRGGDEAREGDAVPRRPRRPLRGPRRRSITRQQAG